MINPFHQPVNTLPRLQAGRPYHRPEVTDRRLPQNRRRNPYRGGIRWTPFEGI